MKEETMEKFCRKLDTAYMYAQVAFAITLAVVSAVYAVAHLINGNFVFSLLTAVLACVAYKLMFRIALNELRAYKNGEEQ